MCYECGDGEFYDPLCRGPEFRVRQRCRLRTVGTASIVCTPRAFAGAVLREREPRVPLKAITRRHEYRNAKRLSSASLMDAMDHTMP